MRQRIVWIDQATLRAAWGRVFSKCSQNSRGLQVDRDTGRVDGRLRLCGGRRAGSLDRLPSDLGVECSPDIGHRIASMQRILARAGRCARVLKERGGLEKAGAPSLTDARAPGCDRDKAGAHLVALGRSGPDRARWRACSSWRSAARTTDLIDVPADAATDFNAM